MDELKESRRRGDCAMVMATIDPLRRTKVVEELLVERLLRKSERVLEVWEESSRDWNQTLYRMCAYAMGAPRNSLPFQRLAQRATYLMCLKERTSPKRVEALLLGVSGLLRGEYYDDYVVGLQQEYEYLAGKYSLKSMNGGEWSRGGNFPAGNPVMRIVQFATLVTKEEFGPDSLFSLRDGAEVERFFAVSPSAYWQQRFTLDGKGAVRVGQIGRDKVNMLAINLVVPMQFAYGHVTRKDELKIRALDMLERLPSESNRLVRRWTAMGVNSRSAYDSQALIELSHMCDEGRCDECPLGKQMKKV